MADLSDDMEDRVLAELGEMENENWHAVTGRTAFCCERMTGAYGRFVSAIGAVDFLTEEERTGLAIADELYGEAMFITFCPFCGQRLTKG